MRLKKIRQRSQLNGWKIARRCVIFFTLICLVPVFLVFIIAIEYYARPIKSLTLDLHRPHPLDTENSQQPLTDSRNIFATARKMEMRRNHLQKTCQILGLNEYANDSLHKPNSWEYLVDKKHHLVWCNVFKSASTSWMYNFNILAGYTPTFLRTSRTPPMTLARQKYGRPTLESLKIALNNSVSFLIVRHPLERLLSAYRDKILFAVPGSIHRKLGKEIIKKYRKKSLIRESVIHPTYSEFVDWLVNSAKKSHSLDMHWAPIVEFCTPCLFNIQIIAHTETLEEDQIYIIKRAKLENLIKPQWKNAGKGSTSSQVTRYYSQLTRSQILQLYHIYRFDFELFNYTLNGYLELGQPDKDPSTLLAAISMKDKNRVHSVPQIF